MEDKSKLAEKQISYLYVHQDEISDLQSHRLQALIDENIEDFNSEARAKDLASKIIKFLLFIFFILFILKALYIFYLLVATFNF
jgi:hypothetical protein